MLLGTLLTVPLVVRQTNAPQILGITGSFFTLAAIVVLLRCYVRLRLLKTFGADDYVMLLAMVGQILLFAVKGILMSRQGPKYGNLRLLQAAH